MSSASAMRSAFSIVGRKRPFSMEMIDWRRGRRVRPAVVWVTSLACSSRLDRLLDAGLVQHV